MRITRILPLAVPLALGLAACGHDDPGTTQVIIQQPATAIVPAAPTAPPAPLSEVVPPPPVSATPTVWQPGHWRYTGVTSRPWSWQTGEYVAVPTGATAWVPGQWQQQGAGWVWREGHWA